MSTIYFFDGKPTFDQHAFDSPINLEGEPASRFPLQIDSMVVKQLEYGRRSHNILEGGNILSFDLFRLL